MKRGFLSFVLWAMLAIVIMFCAFALLPLFTAVAGISGMQTAYLLPIIFLGIVIFGVFVILFPRG